MDEEIAELKGMLALYRADYDAAMAIFEALDVPEKGANLRVRLPLALRAAKQRGRVQALADIRYILEYARACAIEANNTDMAEACTFLLS